MGIIDQLAGNDCLEWETVRSKGAHGTTLRAKVPGGWLVQVTNNQGVGATFVPDSDHNWMRSASRKGLQQARDEASTRRIAGLREEMDNDQGDANEDDVVVAPKPVRDF